MRVRRPRLIARTIPLIVAGGINSHEAVRAWLAAGASGVQLGTPFAVTEEGDAHPNFKRVLAEATPEDIVEFVSVTGLPARAVKTPWLMRYLRHETTIREKIGALKHVCPTALECLSVCGWRDGIENSATSALTRGSPRHCAATWPMVCFSAAAKPCRSASAIRSVHDLIELLLTGATRPAVAGRLAFSLG